MQGASSQRCVGLESNVRLLHIKPPAFLARQVPSQGVEEEATLLLYCVTAALKREEALPSSELGQRGELIVPTPQFRASGTEAPVASSCPGGQRLLRATDGQSANFPRECQQPHSLHRQVGV